MTDEKQLQEQADEEMINQGFQELWTVISQPNIERR